LDTHVWLWLSQAEPERIAPAVVEEVRTASEEGRVLVAAMSVWELAMLEARDRIQLSPPIMEWIERALRAPGTRFLELSPAIAIESTRLPGTPHGDPADRILMASARVSGARLVTCDAAILQYARGGHLAVLDGRP
jgi:PIN domain nuclease of toxin-antitoxin system